MLEQVRVDNFYIRSIYRQNARKTIIMDGQIFTCSSATTTTNDRYNNSIAQGTAAPDEIYKDDDEDNARKNTSNKTTSLLVEGNLNPMFVPSIINHVASFLPCIDLKRCRLLNKQWDEECSKYLRRKGLVRLTSKSSIDNFYEEFHEKPKFFQNFCLTTLSKDIRADKFFEKFGPHIKCFKLDFSGDCHRLPVEELFDLLFTNLPNLQEFSLVGCILDNDHFLPTSKRKEQGRTSIITNNNNNIHSNSGKDSVKPSEETEQGPSTSSTLPLLKYLEIFLYNSCGKDVSKHHFLIELLSCVPNMEKISVPKVPRMLSFGMPLLHTLVTTSELHFDKLQHLEMDVALYNGLIDVLKSKRYPLKYLNAEINSTVSDECLHSLLEAFGRTLETLQLKFPSSTVASSQFTSAASFKRLKSLTLHGYKGPLTFLEQLNELQGLEIIDNSFAVAINRDAFAAPLKAQFSYKMIWTHWHEEAYAFDRINSSDAQLLRQFSKNFHNLTSLNLPHLNDNDLRVIYQTFSHSLQELTMENSLCSDAGLTGMHRDALARAAEGHKPSEKNRTHSYIGNLTRLTRLEILTPSDDVTDASVLHGIIYCENLRVFVLRNAATISDVGLRQAVDLLHLEKLETTMCAKMGGGAVKYALEKMTERGMLFIWNKYQSRLTDCCIHRILSDKSSVPVTCIVP